MVCPSRYFKNVGIRCPFPPQDVCTYVYANTGLKNNSTGILALCNILIRIVQLPTEVHDVCNGDLLEVMITELICIT